MNPSTATEEQDVAGTGPQIDSKLQPSKDTRYSIKDGKQALAVCRNLKTGWNVGIRNMRKLTAQLNGQRPRDPKQLTNQGKGWYPNINTGFLRSICAPVPARFFMPILTAQFLTAAELPTGHPGGASKSASYRDEVTKAVKNWDGFPFFLNLLAREVGFFGFGFVAFFDEYQWRPTFLRQDEAFIPVGTKLLQGPPPLFMCRYSYRVDELLEYAQKDKKAGRSRWKEKAVMAAINAATTKPKDASAGNERKIEEMIREATIGQTYEKAYRTVETWHLFSVDPDKSVSHHILLADDNGKPPEITNTEGTSIALLFECRKQFKAMADVMTPLVFDADTGSVHGSWGVAHMIFDIAIEAEKARNDWIGSVRQLPKIKTEVGEGKSATEVKLKVDDIMMVLEGATFAGSKAAVATTAEPFQALNEELKAAAREKIGNFIPPISITPADIKAAQINENAKEQQERREQMLLMWLIQFGKVMKMIARRITLKDSNDEAAKELRKRLLEIYELQNEEIETLANTPPLSTIWDYTEYAASKRAAFAASKQGNPYYNQSKLERMQAESALGRTVANDVLLPGEDGALQRIARHKQDMEIGTMNQGIALEVLPDDADWFHMQVLRPNLEEDLKQGAFDRASIKLAHYTAHYAAAVAKKTMPMDKVNVEKAFVTKADKAIRMGILPQEGFADQVSPVEAVELAMSQQPVVTGPAAQEEAIA